MCDKKKKDKAELIAYMYTSILMLNIKKYILKRKKKKKAELTKPYQVSELF